ncbi:hypothetical protein ACFQ88_35395 [Paenibacillus sp. NPDC056579]|uniref:hypothetical protein n=1 Tax=Paenibacillus sp. NPDC056579 TaxID=3345871 RepID=UPI00367F95D2
MPYHYFYVTSRTVSTIILQPGGVAVCAGTYLKERRLFVDPVIIAILGVIAIVVLFRLRMTYRKARDTDKSEEIQRKLAELRRKREEE